MSVKMCSVGDLKNNLRILQSEARQMKFAGEFDLDGLTKGNPHALLPLYHHAFNSYNSQFTTDVMELIDDCLYMKSDVRFMEAVYRVLRDMFHFKPSMTKEQFFTMNNFAERKIIMCVDVLRLVQNRCRPKVYPNPNIKVTPIVNSRRISKKSATDLVKQEPGSESARSAPDLRCKAKSNSKGTMSSLMGLDENNWHLKVGYLQPCKDMHKPRKEKVGVVASMVRELDPGAKSPEVPRIPHAEGKQDMKRVDAGPKTNSDWDPTGAVECILAKVKDLPTQLTSFMKAVDGRLQKIEERLEKVEAGVGPEAPALDKDTNNLLARLLLLENRLKLVEAQEQKPGTPANSKEGVESSKSTGTAKKGNEKKVGDKSPASFATLEGGDRPPVNTTAS